MLNISKELKYVYNNSQKYSKKYKKSFIILHEILLEPVIDKISGNAFKLYYILRSFSDGNYKPCYPSTKTLASRMNVSAETVRRCLKELETHELIQVMRHCQGNRNIYHFKSPHTDVGTLENEDRVPTQITGESPQICPHYYKQEFLNQDSEQQHTTLKSQTKLAGNKHVVAVDKSDGIEELTNEYQKLISKLSKPPNNSNSVSTTFVSNLKRKYNTDLVDLVIGYTNWINRYTNAKVQNFIGFVKWQLRNPLETDYSQYFEYLERLYSKQEKSKAAIQKKKFKQEESRHLEAEDPSQNEVDEFFGQLRKAAGVCCNL